MKCKKKVRISGTKDLKLIRKKYEAKLYDASKKEFNKTRTKLEEKTIINMLPKKIQKQK